MRVLGSPIGSDNFIKAWLHVAFLKLSKEASVLQSSITTLHTQWSLIYYCLRNKVNHLFRTVPPRLTKEFCNNTDNLFKSVMEKNISSDINLSAWTQLKLSFDEGGNGWRCVCSCLFSFYCLFHFLFRIRQSRQQHCSFRQSFIYLGSRHLDECFKI